MKKSKTKRKHKIQLINPAALRRLAILAMLLLAILGWLWFTLISMPGISYQGELPPLTAEENLIKNRLQQDLNKLGGEIRYRNSNNYENLQAAADFLESSFQTIGYSVKTQEYSVDNQTFKNLEVEIPGSKHPDEIVIVGAHYDTAFSSPGANDNGSGNVAVLELARRFANTKPHRTLRLVEFVNEEPPFFWTENMGSLVYARNSKKQNEKIIAMLSLETMGYYSEEKDSQKYPTPLNWLYPSKGNFLAFVGNVSSAKLVKKTIASFRRHTQFPSEGVAAPAQIPGIGWSDQWSFWQQGYPGVMVTDTATFRYPYYHTIDDTPDKIDYAKLARVVSGLERVITELVND